MKRLSTYLFCTAIFFCGQINAAGKQDDPIATQYTRCSLYSVLVSHVGEEYADVIREQFLEMPISDQFNDHNLSVKVLNVSQKIKDKEVLDSIDWFINNNGIASRMVARWFDRDLFTGECSMDMIKERGLYNATALDYELAAHSQRGIAMLQDAGEELIGNTYLIVNDVVYKKSNKGRTWGLIAAIGGGVIGAFTGYDTRNLTKNLVDMAESYKNFSVRIRTYLFRLVWDDKTAETFYTNFYTASPDAAKVAAFEANRDKFHLEYVGQVESKGKATSFLGINEEQPYLMVRKACQRAIDENIVDLQTQYEGFRVRAPITEVSPDIKAQIGLKEGVRKGDRFEVLEVRLKDDGRTEYKRVGVVEPIGNKIWDNRYMAVEEQAECATLGATSFKKVSGGDFYPGMLIRRID